MDMILLLNPFGDSIRDSMCTVGHNVVPSRIPEKLMAALAFHFSAPYFSALDCHCRNKKNGLAKR